AHARSARQASADVGHVGAALLVPDGHEFDRRLRERLVQVERLLAGYTEDVSNALGLEAFDEEVRRFPGGHPPSFLGDNFDSTRCSQSLIRRYLATDCRLGAGALR